MTEKQAENRAKTGQDASAQDKSRETEQARPSKDAREQQELAVSEGPETESKKKSSALVGAAKAIEGGAHFVGEKAPEVASFVVHKVKKGVSVAYGTSSTLVKDAYLAASDYADRYKHRHEIKKLKAQRQAVSSRLGSLVYTRIFVGGEQPDKLLSEQEITGLFQEIQNLDNEIVKSGQELQKH